MIKPEGKGGGSNNKLRYWKGAAYKKHTVLHVKYGGADTCGIVSAYIIKGVWGYAPQGTFEFIGYVRWYMRPL